MFVIDPAAGHEQIAARRGRSACPRLSVSLPQIFDIVHHPVGYHNALITALRAQIILRQGAAVGGVPAVYEVVGSHKRQGLRLADTDVKSPQVDLPQGPLADMAVVVIAVLLLIVRREMLDGRAAPRV